MRLLPQPYTDHLDAGATTLCTCWRLRRRDGVVFGMTDHDADLEFDNTIFTATTGVTGSALESSADLSVDNSTIEGALDHTNINPLDIDLGKFDTAELEIFRVNWADTSIRILLKTGTLGEIQHSATGYIAEMRSLVQSLDQTSGRLFQYQCDADLGDTACGVAVENSTHQALAEIITIADTNEINVTGTDSFETGWFSFGKAVFETGQLAGLAFHIKSHAVVGQKVSLSFWRSLPRTPDAGDRLTLTAGCDKQYQTCRRKFNNHLNFRGFPHMPGNDFITRYPVRGETNKGGKRS